LAAENEKNETNRNHNGVQHGQMSLQSSTRRINRLEGQIWFWRRTGVARRRSLAGDRPDFGNTNERIAGTKATSGTWREKPTLISSTISIPVEFSGTTANRLGIRRRHRQIRRLPDSPNALPSGGRIARSVLAFLYRKR